MDNNNNNLRPSPDWRSHFPLESRGKIIDKVINTLSKYIPSSELIALTELQSIAKKYEAKIFNSATTQKDYVHKISMKMLTMESKAKDAAAASSSSNRPANNVTSMDTIPNIQEHVLQGSNQSQAPRLLMSQTMHIPTNQSQAPRSLMGQTMQSNAASGMTGFMRQVSSITNSNVTSGLNRNLNTQSVAGMLQDSSRQHGLSSNVFSGSPRQMLSRPHAMSSQQPQSAQQNIMSGNVPSPSSLLPSHMQQRQQNVLQPPSQQHSVHMLSRPTPGLQQTHQAGGGLFSSQGQQQSQSRLSQQQMMPQLQPRHQQLGLQQQANQMQQDVQQRLQVPGQVTGYPPLNVVNQQRQVYQPQRTLPEMPSSSLESKAQMDNANEGDWQEEVYQKIKSMKEAYLPVLMEIHKRVVSTLQQDCLPQQQSSAQLERVKQLRATLERMIKFLSIPKSQIMHIEKDKVDEYLEQIKGFVNTHRTGRTRQQVQLPQSQTQQPIQQPLAQTVQDQSHDSQTRQQMQSMSMQCSGPMSQQQNIPSSIPASSLVPGQGNAVNYVKQVVMQQTAPQQLNNSSASSQSSSLLQHQHLKQQQRQTQKQHSPQGQRATYPLQPGSHLPVSSPKHLQAASPKMKQQHMSPRVDKKDLPPVNNKRTRLQSANSPVVVQSPATPSAPSPMQVDSEKPSSLSKGNIARQQVTGMEGVAPGISASPLLQEFTSPDGNNVNPLTSASENPSETENPIERLIRAVKSISPQALASAVSDIKSVVSMVDRIACSAPGNDSRASVGEDLAAMTKYCLQAQNFVTQEGMMVTKKLKRHITAMPFSVASYGGSVGDN